MIKDKNGKEVTIKNILQYLVGTDDSNDAISIIDFGLYNINEDKKIDKPSYYMVAVNAIITQISFLGPFTMVEVDFRNTGLQLLKETLLTINRFHNSVNSEDVMMLSTITSLDKNATHILSLANPLKAVRGYSEEGHESSILQMIYASENVGFSVSNIDYEKIQSEIDREVMEIESAMVSKEAVSAAQETIDEIEESDMQKMFKPNFGHDFGITSTEERRQLSKSDVRVTGEENESEKNIKISSSKTSLVNGNRDEEDNV